MVVITEFKEFKLEELFEIKHTKSFNTDSLVPAFEHDSYDYVTRTSENQGVLRKTGFVNSENLNPAKTFSLGLLQMDCFYRPYKWYAGQFVRLVVPKFDINNYLAEYFTTIFYKVKSILKSVLVRNVDEVFNDLLVLLPVQSQQSTEPDWDYMEKTIQKTEAPMLNAVSDYFQKNDAGMSDDEISNILQRYHDAEFSEFRIGDLFEFESIPQAKSQKSIPSSKFGVNYIVQSENNNMFARKVDSDYVKFHDGKIVSGNRISLGVTLPAVAYQPFEFTGSQLITMYSDFLNPILGLYFVTLLKKQMYQFSYNSKPGIKRYQQLLVKLPKTPSGTPDYTLMEDYIKVIQQKYVRNLENKLSQRIATAKTLI